MRSSSFKSNFPWFTVVAEPEVLATSATTSGKPPSEASRVDDGCHTLFSIIKAMMPIDTLSALAGTFHFYVRGDKSFPPNIETNSEAFLPFLFRTCIHNSFVITYE